MLRWTGPLLVYWWQEECNRSKSGRAGALRPLLQTQRVPRHWVGGNLPQRQMSCPRGESGPKKHLASCTTGSHLNCNPELRNTDSWWQCDVVRCFLSFLPPCPQGFLLSSLWRSTPHCLTPQYLDEHLAQERHDEGWVHAAESAHSADGQLPDLKDLVIQSHKQSL